MPMIRVLLGGICRGIASRGGQYSEFVITENLETNITAI